MIDPKSEKLACGHLAVDPSGICQEPGCEDPPYDRDALDEVIKREAKNEAGNLSSGRIPDGLIQRIMEKKVLRRHVIKNGASYLASLAAVLSVFSVYRTESRLADQDLHDEAVWERFINELDRAIESKEKLQRLTSMYKTADHGSLQRALCEGALHHVCYARPSTALKIYRDNGVTSEVFELLPELVQRHIAKRKSKAESLYGDPDEAVASFKIIGDLGLDREPIQKAETNRERLNAHYQTLTPIDFANPSGQHATEVRAEIRKIVCDTEDALDLSDIREGDSWDGLREGTAIFLEILNYIETLEEHHLIEHGAFIVQMMEYRWTTGWNRWSPLAALAIYGGNLEFAHRALHQALNLLLDREVPLYEVDQMAMALARGAVTPHDRRHPGKAELGIHLMMWGQLEFAKYEEGISRTSRETAIEFLEAARTNFNAARIVRFERPIALIFRRLDHSPLDKSIIASSRAFLQPALASGVFLPIQPIEIPA